MLRVLSLGAGVQSTTLALMAAKGEIGPMPDAAIFADTGWEPQAVYDHLAKLEAALPFPVVRVSSGNLREDLIARGSGRAGRFVTVPFYLRHKNGDKGMGRRQCTAHYKIEPINKKLREMLGFRPRQRIPASSVEIWIGISTDEIIRMKPAQQAWITRRWPLIEERLSRNDCIKWMERAGWSAPKSSCIGCPFHNDAFWRDMKNNDPQSWADAVDVDKSIRVIDRIKAEQFMHKSLKPLDQVDLRSDAEMGQFDLFGNECEGMCGV